MEIIKFRNILLKHDLENKGELLENYNHAVLLGHVNILDFLHNVLDILERNKEDDPEHEEYFNNLINEVMALNPFKLLRWWRNKKDIVNIYTDTIYQVPRIRGEKVC